MHYGIVITVFIGERLCGGHQQALCELTLGHAICNAVVLTDILCNDCRDTGDLRRRHGCTGHELVIVVTVRVVCRVYVVVTVYGPDVSAGSGDLGFDGESVVSAP